METHLNTVEAANWLKLEESTLRDWRSDAKGPPYIEISSRCIRYALEDLVKWRNERRLIPRATDFQLVHLHEKSDAREFRTVTGGVFHRSGGASRDAVSFVQTRIAKHIYKIRLAANLPRGEYAFHCR